VTDTGCCDRHKQAFLRELAVPAPTVFSFEFSNTNYRYKYVLGLKSRTMVNGAFRPDTIAVALNNPLHGGQTYTRAGKLTHGVKPLERTE
jgi:hypothetical protein